MLGNPSRYGVERCIEGLRIASACLRKIWPSTAFAADLLGNRPDHVARSYPIDGVLGDACSQPDFAVIDRSEYDDCTLELVLEAIDCIAQRLGVGAVHARSQYVQPVDNDNMFRNITGLAGEEFLPGRSKFFFVILHPAN